MVFGGKQESLVQSVSVPMPEAIQPLSKWKWCSVVDKTNQAASILPKEFGSLCIHAIDVTEGQANKSET
jgi:hypothetical protein